LFVVAVRRLVVGYCKMAVFYLTGFTREDIYTAQAKSGKPYKKSGGLPELRPYMAYINSQQPIAK
jgi:hypothetical protein